MARNTISQLTSRIDDLTERLPGRKRLSSVGAAMRSAGKSWKQMRAAVMANRRHILFIIIDTSGKQTVIDDFRLQYLIDD